MKTGAVILAAGQSRRFGSDKREFILPNGLSMLEQVIANCCSILDHCIVVVDDKSWRKKLAANKNISVLVADKAALGMGDSLAAGAQKAIDLKWDALLVFLADMPFVRAQTIARVRDEVVAHEIVVPVYSGAYKEIDEKEGSIKSYRGHPVGFQSHQFVALTKLHGDSGARALINAQGDKCFFPKTEDEGILQDIDFPSDWHNMQQ